MNKKLFFVSFVLLLAACNSADEISDAAIETAIAQTAEVQAQVDDAVEGTLAAKEAEATPTPVIVFTATPAVPVFDYLGWKIYEDPSGYMFNYPSGFIVELRNEGAFIAVLEEDAPPNALSFSIVVLEDTDLSTVKETTDLDDAVFNDLTEYGMEGFIVEGIVPGDGFGSGSTVYTAYFMLGEQLIQLDCPWNYCDRDQFNGVLWSFAVK